MFLDLVREAGTDDPVLARRALAGLSAYQAAPRGPARRALPAVASAGAAALRDHGGSGPPLVLVPSLINPPSILDLDPDVSLATAMRAAGRRVLMVDWGPAGERRSLDVAGHVAGLLVPLLAKLGEPPALIGYCLGGTMAIAAANLLPVTKVATLASPWHFAGYPASARAALDALWRASRDGAECFGLLPMEVLQAAFWSLDPARVVAKFAAFAALDPDDPRARRFVAMEDWANGGEALPFPAAAELIEQMFGADCTGRGRWRVDGQLIDDRLDCPMLNLTAAADRIAPVATAPAGPSRSIPSGHVGMVVGSARRATWQALDEFLASA